MACGDLKPEDICMSSWFRWTIQIQRTMSGPLITGRVASAHAQHGLYVKWYLKQVRLFVLRPIEDAETRGLLKADYYLEDFSKRLAMYCLEQDPRALGIEDEALGRLVGSDESGYCFEAPESYADTKSRYRILTCASEDGPVAVNPWGAAGACPPTCHEQRIDTHDRSHSCSASGTRSTGPTMAARNR
jgi:hypothetical protein